MMGVCIGSSSNETISGGSSIGVLVSDGVGAYVGCGVAGVGVFLLSRVKVSLMKESSSMVGYQLIVLLVRKKLGAFLSK